MDTRTITLASHIRPRPSPFPESSGLQISKSNSGSAPPHLRGSVRGTILHQTENRKEKLLSLERHPINGASFAELEQERRLSPNLVVEEELKRHLEKRDAELEAERQDRKSRLAGLERITEQTRYSKSVLGKRRASAYSMYGVLPTPHVPITPITPRDHSPLTSHFIQQYKDYTTRLPCQRCSDRKTRCDDQRPCSSCKDAGIGDEGCFTDDEDEQRYLAKKKSWGIGMFRSTSYRTGKSATTASVPPSAYGNEQSTRANRPLDDWTVDRKAEEPVPKMFMCYTISQDTTTGSEARERERLRAVKDRQCKIETLKTKENMTKARKKGMSKYLEKEKNHLHMKKGRDQRPKVVVHNGGGVIPDAPPRNTPSRSPTSATSGMAYTWTSNDKRAVYTNTRQARLRTTCTNCTRRQVRCDAGSPCKPCKDYYKDNIIHRPCVPTVLKTGYYY